MERIVIEVDEATARK